MKPLKKNILLGMMLFLVFAAILVNLALVDEYYAIVSGNYDSAVFCGGESGYLDCGPVFLSRYSKVFGIPLFFFSLFYYGLMFFLLKNFVFLEVKGKDAFLSLGHLLAFITLMLHSVLIVILVFVIQKKCVMCLVIYILNVTIFALLTLHRRCWPVTFSLKFFTDLSQSLLGNVDWREDRQDHEGSVSSCLKMIYGLELVIALAFTLFIFYFQVAKAGPTMSLAYAREVYDKLETVQFDSGLTDTVLSRQGEEKAPVKILYFFDYNCDFCRKTTKSLDLLMDHFKGQIQITYIHFPLDKRCNSQVKSMQKDNSCLFTQLSIRSARWSKFRENYQKLLKISLSKYQFDSHILAGQLGLPNEGTDSIDREIENQVQLAKSCGVQLIPTLVVNGKQVIGNQPTSFLLYLLQKELESRS